MSKVKTSQPVKLPETIRPSHFFKDRSSPIPALRRHRVCLALLAGGMAALALFWAVRGHQGWMNAWVNGVSMPVKRTVSALTEFFPGSMCELGCCVIIVLALWRLFAGILHRGQRVRHLAVWALHTGTVVLWGYVLVCALWGTQYYAASFAERAGMTAGAVRTQDLAAVTTYFAVQVNAAADAVPRDASGCFCAEKSAVLARSAGSFDGATAEYPFLAGPVRTPKPAFFSRLMSAAGFTGYLCPLLGESTLNMDCPAVFLPVTVTHELAHQRGVAAEQEANYLGIEAGVTSSDPWYRYSAWLFGYLHLSNALYSADRADWQTVNDTLCAGARADLSANDAYWAAWQGPANTAGEKVYTAFLQSYGQTMGFKSYGACVDLLVERYLPLAAAA